MPLKIRTALIVAVLAVFALAVSTPTHAEPITIAFDSPPATEFLPGIYAPNTYALQGVYLTSGRAVNVGYGGFGIGPSSRAVSAPNVAFGRDPFAATTPFLRGTFALPGAPPPSSAVFVGTNLLSLYVIGTQPGQTIPWSLSIYATNMPITESNLLETITGTTDGLVTFSRSSADIGSFVFYGPNLEGIDNLTFNTPTQAAAIPEPATLVLLGTGIAGIMMKVRRRREAEKRLRT